MGMPTEAHRAIALVLPGESLRCPHGHTIPKHFFPIRDDAQHGYRCQFRTPPGDEICGAGVLVLPMITVVADVTTSELADMEKRKMTMAQIRDVLGLLWRAA
jgi:hypothetical protein